MIGYWVGEMQRRLVILLLTFLALGRAGQSATASKLVLTTTDDSVSSAGTAVEPVSNAPPAINITPMPAVPAPAKNVRAVAGANNAFATDLYARLKSQDGNLAFSPASIVFALGMTYLGARGKTASQMKSTLRLPLEGKALERAFATLLRDWLAASGKTYELRVANRGFADKTFPYTWV